VANETSCLFCRIVQGEIPATIVHRGDGVTAFRDIAPQAPVHILIIPDEHISGADAMTAQHEQVVGRLVYVAAELARKEGIAESGYRLIVNQGREAGQSVNHLHVHLLGGRPLPTPLV
jgi:histidine triad (HIT) family protein